MNIGLSRSLLQAALSMFDTDCGELQLPLYPSGPHCVLRSISELLADHSSTCLLKMCHQQDMCLCLKFIEHEAT